jgi:hypothetical protein
MRILATLTVLATLCAPVSHSQTPAPAGAMPACDGAMAIVRLSEITPGGSMDKFMAAVAAHQAWYTSHGFPDDLIYVTHVIVRDPATKSYSYSDKQILTYHFMPKTNAAEPKHDDAWDAYVKLYQATSTIKEGYLTCVPTADLPTGFKAGQ